MNNKIRIGVLGCSAIASRSVLPAIWDNPRLLLVAVGSRSEEKGLRFAEQFGCKAGSYEDILSDRDIEAVYVSLPVGLHHEWGERVIRAGKHLLMEKTFTHSFFSAEQLINLAVQKGCVAMEALSYIYHPLFQGVKEAVTTGALGALRHVEAFFGFPYLPDGDIRYVSKLGGGATLDALIYPLSFCLHIGGIDYLSYSHRVIYDDNRDVDVRGFLQMNWAQHSAHMGYGFGFTYRNTYTVWGEMGYLTADRVFSRPRDFVDEMRIVRQGRTETIPIPAADHFNLMLDAFATKIAGNDRSGLNEGQDILTRMKIISHLREICCGFDAKEHEE